MMDIVKMRMKKMAGRTFYSYSISVRVQVHGSGESIIDIPIDMTLVGGKLIYDQKE